MALRFGNWCGMLPKKELTVDAILDRFGRIVIPKRVRDHLDLRAGSQIRIEETEDGIVLKPIYGEPNLIEKDGVLVFSGAAVGDIEDALRENRTERSSAIVGKSEDSV